MINSAPKIVLFNFKILNLDCFLLLYVVKLKKLFYLAWQLFCFRQFMILNFNAIWRLFVSARKKQSNIANINLHFTVVRITLINFN